MQSEATSIFSDGQFPTAEKQNPRPATIDDLYDVVEMARAFHAYSIWKDTPFDERAVSETFYSLVNGNGGVFRTETGFIAGVLLPLHFCPDIVVVHELAWWSPDGNGKELRAALEQWAKDSGASILKFSALVDDNLDAVNEKMVRNGFRAMEVSYTKRL